MSNQLKTINEDEWNNLTQPDRYSLCINSLGLYDNKFKHTWSKQDWNHLPKYVQLALQGPLVN